MLDAHIHYLLPTWAEQLWAPEVRQISTLWPRLQLRQHLLADPELALAALDARGVRHAVISPEMSCPPGPQTPGGPTAALALTRAMNHATAALVARYPDRLRGLAVVNPLGSDADLEELQHAIVALGLHGVIVGASYRGVAIDAAAAQPFLGLVEALDVPLFIHPTVAGGVQTPRDFGLDALLAMPFDLTQTGVRLIVSGRLQQYARLRVVLTHLGGALPSLLGWLDMLATPVGPRPAIAARRFWVDTATASPAALAQAVAVFGAEHVLLGTDWPLSTAPHLHDSQTDPAAIIRQAALTPLERAAILEGTALALFAPGGLATTKPAP